MTTTAKPIAGTPRELTASELDRVAGGMDVHIQDVSSTIKTTSGAGGAGSGSGGTIASLGALLLGVALAALNAR